MEDTLQRIQQPKKRAFIRAFRLTGILARAAKAARIDRGSHYRWLKSDPEYRRAFEESQERLLGIAEDELFDRAINGWDEPVFYRGEIVGNVRKKDAAYLIFLLKALAAQKYRENRTEAPSEVPVADAVALRKALLNEPEYLDYQRNRLSSTDGNSGPVGNGSEPGAMEPSPPHGSNGRGANGSRPSPGKG